MRINSGIYKNYRLQAPKGLETRPTTGQVREALFNIIAGGIEEASLLDLFAGSGAVGFEALSRAAQEVVFIDQSRKSIESIRANIEKLSVQKATQALQGDVYFHLERLAKKKNQFDFIFADPPYATSKEEISHGQRLLKALDQIDLLKENGELWIEESEDFWPDTVDLKKLFLVDHRQYGRSHLFRFQRISQVANPK